VRAWRFSADHEVVCRHCGRWVRCDQTWEWHVNPDRDVWTCIDCDPDEEPGEVE
jgi:hypothetical protein